MTERDPILRLLSALPPAASSSAHESRVRLRCHAALAERPRRVRRFGGLALRAVAAALIVAAATYTAAAAVDAIRLAGGL